ncbi:hypothetical protein HANVADRAFT_54785 [Hanseniaspora valbyensis NRRL Y-1626]|uniref:Uncharacterized protein n=1 Tax=Hanseniaspora valbyensis NRRL Y-1626 TaxID=766949 RepID=A0A1B7TJD9_9ASCO|nr:hypothetical protein HANVADRAFT_54785 [Hanseniaspora valbyensis NRRL Y-1626]
MIVDCSVCHKLYDFTEPYFLADCAHILCEKHKTQSEINNCCVNCKHQDNTNTCKGIKFIKLENFKYNENSDEIDVDTLKDSTYEINNSGNGINNFFIDITTQLEDFYSVSKFQIVNLKDRCRFLTEKNVNLEEVISNQKELLKQCQEELHNFQKLQKNYNILTEKYNRLNENSKENLHNRKYLQPTTNNLKHEKQQLEEEYDNFISLLSSDDENNKAVNNPNEVRNESRNNFVLKVKQSVGNISKHTNNINHTNYQKTRYIGSPTRNLKLKHNSSVMIGESTRNESSNTLLKRLEKKNILINNNNNNNKINLDLIRNDKVCSNISTTNRLRNALEPTKTLLNRTSRASRDSNNYNSRVNSKQNTSLSYAPMLQLQQNLQKESNNILRYNPNRIGSGSKGIFLHGKRSK